MPPLAPMSKLLILHAQSTMPNDAMCASEIRNQADTATPITNPQQRLADVPVVTVEE
jgi:hypothetical protein